MPDDTHDNTTNDPAAASSDEQEATPASARDLRADVEQILKEVKLPERRGSEAAPGATKPSIVHAVIAPSASSLNAVAETPLEEKKQVPQPETAGPVHAPATTPAKGDSPVVALHTLKDDMVQAVRIEKMSLVKAASLEQDRSAHRAKEAKPDETPGERQRRRRTFGIVFASALFIFLGIAAIGGVVFIASQHAPQVVPPPSSSLIFAEQNVQFPLDGSSPDQLKQHIVSMLSASAGSLGSVARVVATVATSTSDGTESTRVATAQEFLAALGTNPPDELLRALSGDFFFGVHTADTNAPVFVFSVLSYEHAFAGMLAWERLMDAELAPIFPGVSSYVAGPDGIPRERHFDDAIMRNYDVRVLRNDAGEIVLYYSFPAPNLLVVARSPYSFAEVLTRLRAQRRL